MEQTLQLRIFALCCRELSKRSADHLILFPALFLCTVQNIIILPGAKSGTDDFDANLFVLMAALWLLWFGHIVQVRLELIGWLREDSMSSVDDSSSCRLCNMCRYLREEAAPVVVVLSGHVCLWCAVSGAKQCVWFHHTMDIRRQQLHLHPANRRYISLQYILFSWIQQLKQDLARSAVYSIHLTFGNFQNSSVVVLLLHDCRQDRRSIGSDIVDSCLVCACRLASVGCSVGILLRPLRGHLGTLLWLYHKLIRSWSASLE